MAIHSKDHDETLSNPGLTHVQPDVSPGAIVDLLQHDGGLIVDEVVSADHLSKIRAELEPYVEATKAGREEFAGYETRRVGALMAHSPACRDLALHPLVNTACAQFLGPYCDSVQLHFTQAVSIGPGQGGKALHRDRGVWGSYIPRSIETQFSTIWAISDFTEANGATQVVPGSQGWDRHRQPQAHEIVSAEMSAGSVLLYTGSIMHGGGKNQSQEHRLGVLLHYAPSWLCQQENQYLSCPPDVARDLDPELRALIGYSKGGPILGFFSSPDGPGEGLEIAPPERIFGAQDARYTRVGNADDLMKATTRGVRVTRPDARD